MELFEVRVGRSSYAVFYQSLSHMYPLTFLCLSYDLRKCTCTEWYKYASCEVDVQSMFTILSLMGHFPHKMLYAIHPWALLSSMCSGFVLQWNQSHLCKKTKPRKQKVKTNIVC